MLFSRKARNHGKEKILEKNGMEKTGTVHTPVIALKKNLLRRTKIHARFMVSFLILSIVPLLIVGLLSVRMSGSAVENKIESYSSELLKSAGNYVNLETARYIGINKEVALSDLVQKDLVIIDRMNEISQRQTGQSIERYLTNKFLTDEKVICSVIMTEDRLFKYGTSNILQKSEWEEIYNRVLESGGGAKDFKTLSLYKKLENADSVIYANNITDALTDEHIGVIITIIDEEYLFNSFRDVQIAEDSEVLVIDSEGVIVSSTNRQEVGSVISDTELIEHVINSAENQESFHYDDSLVSAQKLSPSGWYLISKIPYTYLYKESRSIQSFVILFIIISFILSFIAATIISGSISIPLKKLVEAMKKAKEGDLTISSRDDNKDEIAILFYNFNQMLSNIKNLIIKVRNSAQQVLEGSARVEVSADQSLIFSQQIAAAVSQIAEGSANQAANTVESVEYMSFLSNDIQEVGNIMGEVSENLSKTRDMSRSIQEHVHSLKEKALKTSQITGTVVNGIMELNDDMERIGEVTNMITSISEQTNLLSLNAAIEAARAGEAGRGFAVVAEEVKKLSDQTKEASQSISNLLEKIQDKAQSSAEQAAGAIRIVDEQSEAVNIANESFRNIFENMENIFSLIDKLDQYCNKMLTSKEKSAKAMENISALSEEFAATAQEVSASTEENIESSEKLAEYAKNMRALAKELEQMILNFKTEI